MDDTKHDKGALALTMFFLAGLLVADCRRGFADDLGHLPRVGIYGVTKEEYIEARIWLARACIAEENFGDRAGCAAVAHVYGRRASRHGGPSLLRVVTGHAAALRTRQTYTRRQLFIRSLPEGASSAQKADFEATISLIDRWYQGRVKDPCQGNPTDFGASTDLKPLGGHVVDCDGPDSVFYRIDVNEARAARRAAIQ